MSTINQSINQSIRASDSTNWQTLCALQIFALYWIVGLS